MASCPCLFSFTCMVTSNNSSRIICSLMAFELPELDDEWPESGHGDTWHCPRAGASSPLIVTPALVNQENQHLFVKYLGWEIPPPAIRFRRLPRILAARTSAVCNLTLLHWPRHLATSLLGVCNGHLNTKTKIHRNDFIIRLFCFINHYFLCFQTRHT